MNWVLEDNKEYLLTLLGIIDCVLLKEIRKKKRKRNSPLFEINPKNSLGVSVRD